MPLDVAYRSFYKPQLSQIDPREAHSDGHKGGRSV